MRPNEINPSNEKHINEKVLQKTLQNVQHKAADSVKISKSTLLKIKEGKALPSAPESSGSLQAPLKQSRAENPAKVLLPAMEVFRNTAASLGFPSDTLSTSLLAFLRMFSLSPGMLGELRKETLAHLKTAAPKDKKEKAVLESKALAAVAAFDKGLKLNPAALERYANLLLAKEEAKTDRQTKEENINPDELKILIDKESQEDTFLEFMNYLPGKNGQKWHILPFTIKLDGTELNVILRILYARDEECMIITVNAPKKQWHFFMRKYKEVTRIDLLVHPDQSKRKLEYFAKKIKEGLGKDFGELWVSVKNAEEDNSFLEILYNEPLPLLNKEV